MNNRIVGLDMLRIFSMCGIVGLHVINKGGMIEKANIHSIKYYVILLILVLFYTSVNLFGLLSGFLNISKKKNKHCRIIELWMIVAYYCLLIPTVFYIFNFKGIRSTGLKEIFFNYIPVRNTYWYIWCYTLLFLLIPFINRFCSCLNRKAFKKLLTLLFVMFTIIPNLLFTDVFKVQAGYSVIWLIYCYMIGAYVKKYDLKMNKMRIVRYIIGLWLLIFVINGLTRNLGFLLFKRVVQGEWLIDYISPLTTLLSVCLLLYFKEVDMTSKRVRSVCQYLSEMSFSVYIIHCNRVIFNLMVKDAFVPLLNYNTIIMFFGIILSIAMIYIVCCVLDEGRKAIFKLFRMNRISDFFGAKLDRLLDCSQE